MNTLELNIFRRRHESAHKMIRDRTFETIRHQSLVLYINVIINSTVAVRSFNNSSFSLVQGNAKAKGRFQYKWELKSFTIVIRTNKQTYAMTFVMYGFQFGSAAMLLYSLLRGKIVALLLSSGFFMQSSRSLYFTVLAFRDEIFSLSDSGD